MVPIYDFGGSGQILHIAPANGFPPQTYLPLLEPLMQHHHVVNLMPRALWDDTLPPEKLLSWKELVAKDLHQGMLEHDLRDMIAIGHSFGGIATLLAAIQDPSRFKALILLDPTIFPRPYMKAIQVSRLLGRKMNTPLAERTTKRKAIFDSVDIAYEYFKGKKLFADWDEQALRQYAQSMKQNTDGTVSLAWKREWEAYYFRTIYGGTWGELPKLRGKMPILLIRGETSDTLFASVAKSIQKILPEMTYHEIAGHGHLFPQSAPQQTANVILNWLDKI